MKLRITVILLLCLLVLAGCWDQQLLKDARLVYGLSFDLEEDGTILTTAAIRSLKQSSRGSSEIEATNVIISAKGDTLRDTRMNLDRKLAGEYAPNKTRVFLLGDELARNDIYPILDILYRDPRSSLGAKVVIAEGRGDAIIKLNQVEQVLISEEILELVKSAEANSMVKKETVQSICTIMFDIGQDLYLPYIEKTKDNEVNVKGVALFNGRKYTGINLSSDDSTLLLLMNDEKNKFARFTLRVNPDEKNIREQYVSIQVKESKPKIKIKELHNHSVSVDISLTLKVDVMEYPKNQLADEKEIKRLNKKMSEILSKKSVQIIHTLQKANCDAFGIGRELIAFHPTVWKNMNWKMEYPQISIQPIVNVEIDGTGIIK